MSRYKTNFDADGNWLAPKDFIITPDGRISRKGLLAFLQCLRVPPRELSPTKDGSPEIMVEALGWCMHMYTTGECANTLW